MTISNSLLIQRRERLQNDLDEARNTLFDLQQEVTEVTRRIDGITGEMSEIDQELGN